MADMCRHIFSPFLIRPFDGYDFLSNFTAHSDSLAYVEMAGYDSRYQGGGDASARGLLTGTATRVLGKDLLHGKIILLPKQ